MADRQDGLEHALAESLAVRGNKPGMEELRVVLERALFFFYEGYRATPESIYEFGGGWIAEQALAIGVWCALTATSFEQAVIGAVNHSGDSGSIGLITGHLLGGRYGAAAIPARWYEGQELRSGTEIIAHGIDRMQREYSGCGGAADGEI